MIAIADEGHPLEPQLYCIADPVSADGTREFEVVNGGWRGKIVTPNRIVILGLNEDGVRLPGIVVWEGEVPADKRHYNDALPWIREQLRKGQPS